MGSLSGSGAYISKAEATLVASSNRRFRERERYEQEKIFSRHRGGLPHPIGRKKTTSSRARISAMEKAIDRQRVLLAHLLPSSSSDQSLLSVSQFLFLSLAILFVISISLSLSLDSIQFDCWLIGSGVGVRRRGQRRLPEDFRLRGRRRRRRVSFYIPNPFFFPTTTCYYLHGTPIKVTC